MRTRAVSNALGRVRRLFKALGDNSGYDIKKFSIFLGVAFAAYYLIAEPVQGAAFVRQAITGIGDAAGSVAEFFRLLVSGS